MYFPKARVTQALVFFTWILLVGVGFKRLMTYANSAGLPAIEKVQWPSNSKIRPEPGLASLVIFAHPRCPCSNATVGELERLIPYTKGKIKNFVVFVKPKGLSENWAKESLWKKSESIPEVQAILDEGGSEAIKFGAQTSGQVFLYSKEGHLLFQGGITPARGHMGDSDGRKAILEFSDTGTTKISKTLVFGCALANPERAIAELKK